MVWVFRFGLTILWYGWAFDSTSVMDAKYSNIILFIGAIVVWNIGTILGRVAVLLEMLT